MKLSHVNNIKNKNEICNEEDEDDIDKSITRIVIHHDSVKNVAFQKDWIS